MVIEVVPELPRTTSNYLELLFKPYKVLKINLVV